MDCEVRDPDMGCPSVRIRFRIDWNGRLMVARTEVPFLLEQSAKLYALRYSKDLPITVRINPKNPGKLLFFDSD
jgi:hypothetical protein